MRRAFAGPRGRRPPPGLPRKRERRKIELAGRARKKSGPPGGGPPVSSGEGTDQKLSAMPVTKPVPSFMSPVTLSLLVVSSTAKTELFHATPGASE